MKAIILIFMLLNLSVTSVRADEGEQWLTNRNEGLVFSYAGASLQQNWEQLHRADGIPFPSQTTIEELLYPYLSTELESEAIPTLYRHDFEELSKQVQQSWRLFHAGQYKDAYSLANKLGVAGLIPKWRSLAIHHHYFLESREAKQVTFAALIREIEHLQKRYSLELPEIYLIKAFAIGRYGQEINPVSAFAKGLGGKLKRNIYMAAKLDPANTEAMMFKAVFDTEAINHAGAVASKLLYGASKKRALNYFSNALASAPTNTALLLEFGKACLNICKKKHSDRAYLALQELIETPSLDLGDEENKKMARQILDGQLAKNKPEATLYHQQISVPANS